MLAPGKYRIKMVVRENGTGKIGTFDTRFEVPDLSQQAGAMKMSSVVWANQREPLKAAVGAAEKQKDKLLAADPLVQDGQKLVPSVTKVFRKSQNLYVYSEIYEPAADPEARTPRIAATLAIYRGSVKEFESNPVRLTALGTASGHAADRVPGAAGEAGAGPVHGAVERDRRSRQKVRVQTIAAGTGTLSLRQMICPLRAHPLS